MAAVKRGIFGTIFDRLFAWSKGLRPETCDYTVQSFRIPVEKEVTLAADLYQPYDYKAIGTLLVRTPYGINLPSALTQARIYAARGYQVLLSSCRGTFESGGVFDPGSNEIADGKAVVAWMKQQPWYTGSFATLGGSYLGYTQWALLTDPPQDMKAAVISTGPHDFARFIWATGALDSNIIAWADMQRRMKRGDNVFSILYALRSQAQRLRPVYNSVPLIDAVDKFFDGEAPAWLHQKLEHPDTNDKYWEPFKLNDALQRANIPILLTAGWDDIIMPDVMQQYAALINRDCQVDLIVGPWTHLSSQRETTRDNLLWLDRNYAHLNDNARQPCARIFITGAQKWVDFANWPPPTTPRDIFLADSKSLSFEAFPSKPAESSFRFDPFNPTPAVAVPLLFDNGSGRNENDASLAVRSDVLTFTSDPLKYDIEICGKPAIELHHSTDLPHADLVILLSDVDDSGKSSRSIAERYLRFPTERGPGALSLDLTDCAHRFKKGNRIRLLIAGGSHPRYIRNLGSGEDLLRGSKLQSIRHTIRYGGTTISKLILPVHGSND